MGAGRLDEGDAVSTGDKWDVFYVLDQAMTELVKSVDARATSARQAGRRPRTRSPSRSPRAVTVARRSCSACSSRSSSRAASSAASGGVRAGLERLAAGDLAVRLPVRGRDEVGQMAVALNSAAATMAATVG